MAVRTHMNDSSANVGSIGSTHRSDKKRLASHFAWNVASSGIAAIAVFLTNIVVGNFLSIDDFGAYSLILTVYLIFSSLGTLGTHSAIVKYVAEYHSNRVRQGQYLFAALLFSTAFGLLVSVAFLMGGAMWIGNVFRSVSIGRGLEIIALGLPLFLCNRVLFGFLNGVRAMRAYAVAEIMRYALWLGITCVLLVGGLGLQGAVWAIAISEFPVLVWTGLAATKRAPLRLRGSLSILPSLITFGSQVFIGAIMGIIYSRLGLLLLGYFGSQADVAIMNVGLFFSAGLLMPPSVIGRIVYSAFTEYWSGCETSKAERLIQETARFAAIISLLLGGLVAVALPWVIPIIYPGKPELTQSALVFSIVMLSAVPYNISAATSNVLLGVGRPDYYLKITAVVFAVNGLVGIVLIPRFGVIGAAVSLAVTSLMSGGLVLFVISRLIGIQLDLRRLSITLLLAWFIITPQILLPPGTTRTSLGLVGIVGSVGVLWLTKLLTWQDIRLVANMLQFRYDTSLQGKRDGQKQGALK